MEIAERLGISPKKAASWRNRFLDVGLKGLEKDAPRPGRTPSITPALVQLVVEKTTQSKPANATHWSTRSLAAELNISDSSVLRIWRAHGLKPGQQRSTVCREAGSDCRPVSESSGTCGGAVRR